MAKPERSDSAAADRLANAQRLANDIEDGWYVNLGVGMPMTISELINDGREIVFHSENGILGMGPSPAEMEIDRWLVNAGKRPITLRAGASLFHHADSFTMIRGGHLDLCVLGAYEVSETGDLANWTTPTGDILPAVGGAMDLAVGAKRVWVLMDHTTREGLPKLVSRCSYPLTAVGSVNRIYTNLGVFEVTARGFEVVRLAPGKTLETVQAQTGAKLNMRAQTAA